MMAEEENYKKSRMTLAAKNTIPLQIGTITLFYLFENNLTIPDFQRPYEWNERLVSKLLQDIDNHFFYQNKLKEEVVDFYMGSVLLYKNSDDNGLNVVDGQQRLTTFLILDFLVRGNNSWLEKGIEFLFFSNISVENINSIKKYVNKIKDNYLFVQEKYYLSIVQNILLNVVITDNEDNAFMFFDSLNSKGKKLDSINILKSFHLRELESEKVLQLNSAANFDALNAKVESKQFKANKIYSLNEFVMLFWVQHYHWIKGNFQDVEKDILEDYFQKNAVEYDSKDKYKLKLYPGMRNMRNYEVLLGENGNAFRSQLDNASNKCIEFNPLQPVQKGLGFFISLQNLKDNFVDLFEECKSPFLQKINGIVKSTYNNYFLHLYYLLVLGYYVKFENYRLDEFAFEIEQIIGQKFLALQSVRKESPLVLLRDELNILQQIYLNIDADILLSEIKEFKNSIKVNQIDETQKDGKAISVIKINNHPDIEYFSHTSRPSYVRRILEEYGFTNNTMNEYTSLNWNKIVK